MAPHAQKARNTQRKRTELNKAIERKKTKKERIDTGTITDEEIKNDIKQDTKRKTKGLSSITNKLDYKSKSGADAGKTNEHMMRLSEYSAHGSNWADELARILKEEIAKSAKTLVTYIDPSYKKRTKEGRTTTEKEFLTDTMKNVRIQLRKAIIDLEAGSEEVSLDALKEQAAVLKVLNKAIGKTAEDAEKMIVNTIEKQYTQSEKKRFGGTSLKEGEEKGVGPGHENTQRLVSQLYTSMKQWDSEVMADTIAKEMVLGIDKTIAKSESKRKRKSSESQATRKTQEVQMSDTYKTELAKLNAATDGVFDEIKTSNKAIEKQTNYDKIENAAERVADSKESQKNDEINKGIKEDLSTGFNTDVKANAAIDALKKASSDTEQITLDSDTAGILTLISNNLKSILDILKLKKQTKKDQKKSEQNIEQIPETKDFSSLSMEINKAYETLKEPFENSGLPALYRSFDKNGLWGTANVKDITDNLTKELTGRNQQQWADARHKREVNAVEEERDLIEKGKHPSQQRTSSIPLSGYISSAFKDKSVINSIKRAFGVLDKNTNANKILAMNQAEQERLLKERIAKFGLSDTDRNVTATGDKSRVQRIKSLYNWGGKNKVDANPFKDLKLTPGIGIDTKGIIEALQTSIEKNMFSAQTGGGFFKNLLGSITLYAGQPSIEKTRSQADAANTIMMYIRDAALELLEAIRGKETALRGMESSGQAKFNKDGTLAEGSSNAAVTLFSQMEEQKLALSGVLAEAQMVEQVVKATGGDVTAILQQLGFAAPELRKCNKILQNVNAGLDKNGKSLKFQTRTQEIMNYSYQLMSRHIGQMIKNWMMMLNPINLIKKAFSDFASYDAKWQRTMNVIKYNLRRIIRPAMEWIAQQIVNIIGLVNALMKGVGKAFGKNWDLFDKDAAEAEKIREELEAAANVTLGFDELHDIGTDNSGANDLTGDIYEPQWDSLYTVLEDFGAKVGEFFANISEKIKNMNFWDWLALGAKALAGFLILKTLINLFKGKNPLQSVSDGVKSLLKSVGNALTIASLALFVKCLGDFVEVMKTASWEDVAKSLVMLAGGLGALLLTLWGISSIITSSGIGAAAMALVALIIAAIALLVFALSDFIKTVSEHKDAFILIIDAIKEVMQIFNDFIINILTTLGEFIVNLVGTILQGIVDIIQTVGEVIATLIQTICDSIAEIIRAVGDAIQAIAQGIADIVTAILEGVASVIESIGEAIKSVLEGLGTAFEGFASVVEAVGTTIKNVLEGIATAISIFLEGIATAIKTVVEGIANAIKTVLEPILGFIDSVIGKITDLAKTIAHEIGETIRSIIETTGKVIVDIIDKILNAIPRLLDSILRFCREIGPAIENSVDAILRSVTRLINFMISGIEYLVNTLLIGSLNKAIEKATMGMWKNALGSGISIPRFQPQYYEKGTNYVPSNGLAYLHQGEAVIPKKYNQPYQPGGLSSEERAYMERMISTMNSLDDTMKQGINVRGEFKQRGSDLVATVEKNKNRQSNNVLNNKVFAR